MYCLSERRMDPSEQKPVVPLLHSVHCLLRLPPPRHYVHPHRRLPLLVRQPVPLPRCVCVCLKC